MWILYCTLSSFFRAELNWPKILHVIKKKKKMHFLNIFKNIYISMNMYAIHRQVNKIFSKTTGVVVKEPGWIHYRQKVYTKVYMLQLHRIYRVIEKVCRMYH